MQEEIWRRDKEAKKVEDLQKMQRETVDDSKKSEEVWRRRERCRRRRRMLIIKLVRQTSK